MKKRTIFIGTVVLLAIAFALGTSFYKTQKTEQATQATAQNKEALVRFHSPTLGNANAPVHIVEFLDPACESCRAFYPFVKEIMASNPDKIRLTIRYAPFHKGADEVVKVLEAARKQGKYWETLEALLVAQPQWAPDHSAHLDLVWPHLNGLSLDIERLKEDMKSPDITKLIQQDLEDVKTLNVRGTPEFFVNGRPLPSFGPDQLQKLVEVELSRTN
ncbi:disulfide bond formation protein DsbA [Noviherbaspirillum cavernae]|uniref:Disulfide bond formation protein DsbA n=1 Tax=Noviherbaspirillum cavernae TaxID=2320862 RepID=A0A418X4K7_9BURK|nr:thioredoxin domain-containing protein [Noviherbaspirillum cavernae]RJG07365.1 disulfide bond formation protein DsbA [Noviherbaspirillum cavernae]